MRGRTGIALVALVVLAGMSVRAQGQMAASGAWVMEPTEGASSTAAFAVIENPSMYDVYVVSVTSDAAGAAEIVEGTTEAAKAVKELSVPAYGQTELKPDGIQIRLRDLKRPLKDGDTVELTLTLDSGATIKVMAPVKKG